MNRLKQTKFCPCSNSSSSCLEVLRSSRFMRNMLHSGRLWASPPAPSFLTFLPDFTTQVSPVGCDFTSVAFNLRQIEQKQTSSRLAVNESCVPDVISSWFGRVLPLCSQCRCLIPDMKRSPSRRLNRPQTAGVRASVQVWLQRISVKIQKVFFKTTSFLPLSLTSSLSARCVFIPAV